MQSLASLSMLQHQVIGNKWELYLELLQAGYAEQYVD